jgi:hypothetical protein
MTTKADWVWMPHAAHFILGHKCRFHLATYIPGQDVIVSTVGEYFPDEGVRETIAKSRGVILKGRGDEREHDYMQRIGFEKIGCDRIYETMVFKAVPGEKCGCAFVAADGSELDFHGYNDAEAAYAGHIELCEKWSRDIPEPEPNP